MKYLCTAVILCALCLPFMPGCKKQKESVKPVAFDFGYSGILREGEEIAFLETPPDTTQFLWDFGDGGSAPYSYARHTYAHSGTYAVSVTPNGDVSRRVTKTINISTNTFLSYLISGTKVWHPIKYTTEHKDTTWQTTQVILPDTTFAIIYVDSSAISVNGILPYNEWSSNDTLARFGGLYYYSSTNIMVDYNMHTHKIICTNGYGYANLYFKTVYTTN